MKKRKLDELGRVDVPTFKELAKTPIVFVLDNIRSALNVGAAFRTGDAFRIEHIYLCGITATPPHKEIIKTAIGATASVDWSYQKEIVEILNELKQADYHIMGIEQTDCSEELQHWEPKKEEKYAFVYGNEVDGISEESLPLLDKALEIPQYGTKHSFNVAVSMGIVAWHYMLHANPHV